MWVFWKRLTTYRAILLVPNTLLPSGTGQVPARSTYCVCSSTGTVLLMTFDPLHFTNDTIPSRRAFGLGSLTKHGAILLVTRRRVHPFRGETPTRLLLYINMVKK